MQAKGALIFDFDGVLADSEIIANTVLAKLLSDIGLPTDLEESLATYCGRRWSDVAARISDSLDAALPDDFQDRVLCETLQAFSAGLIETPGASAFMGRFLHLPRCIASSSAASRLNHCVQLLGLSGLFGRNVLSADRVKHGKPAPDIFLLAAAHLGVRPHRCIVFEDAPAGVMAGCAADMTVIGFCGGSHIRSGHADTLRAAGAHYLAADWDEASAITARILRDLV